MAEVYSTTNNSTGNILDKIKDKINGTTPDSGVVYVNNSGEVALALKYKNKCYIKSYDSDIKQSEDENCLVPIDYLMVVDIKDEAGKKVFNSEIAKEQVEKIIIVSTNEVDSDVLGSFDVSENQNGSIMAWYKDEDNNGLYELYIGQEGGVKANPNSKYLFALYTNATSMDLNKLDTSNIIDMGGLFVKCSSLEQINLKNFNTSNAIDINRMFQYCTKLKELDLSSFDTSNVIDMQRMFYGCTSLTSLNLNNFDTSKVTSMYAIFFDCSSLNNLNLRNFNTSNVIDISFMFSGCTSLTTLDLSDFDTKKATTMKAMFQHCSNLETLDLRNFNTNNVTDMMGMFNQCTNLKTIKMSKADFTKVTTYDYMFTSSGITEITVKDESAKTFIESRLNEESILSATITIG